ncbi:MAG: polysaccharide deacetylase family protein [Pseudonocardiaceae bacterium]|nr:polysaccharide deacetylase family protein [Pseudonocardiaceae bacterium]
MPRLLAVLGEHRVTATFFAVGMDVERDDGMRAVADVAAAGHEVANHSYRHEPWLHRYSRAELAAELARTEAAIVAAGAPRPVGFRGPGYSVSPDLLAVLAERGYTYDASVLPTWIGPLARAFHNRTAPPAHVDERRERRDELFGGFSRVLAPNRAHRWRLADGTHLVELPVTTMPLLRVPVHGAYVLALYSISPRLARGYFATAIRLCRALGVGPSLLVHPTDVLGGTAAPGMEFFPGMAVPAGQKVALLDWMLATMSRHFDVVGTGEHVERTGVPSRTRRVCAG